MKKQPHKTVIEFTDMELAVMLVLLESTIGGPTWRRNERDGTRLIAKIDEHATRPRD